jgi:hypothetical protein
MKTTLFVLFILCAATAVAQSASVIPNQPQPAVFVDHPMHAEPHSMATESPIAGTSSDAYSYARGEQPLWQFGPISEPVPLGDVARAYRNQKSVAKKAAIVFEK